MTELNLATAAGVREVSARYGLLAKKKLGQHFLIDGHVLGKIIAAAEIGADDLVLEVGPGIGGMTQALLNAGASVLAVELDKQLVPILQVMFTGEKFTIVQGDILRVDLAEIIPAGRKIKVVANLPYYITTPVIFRLLESGLPFESITVMIQKEVAARMNASPSNKDYGSLTLAVQYHADVSLVANVPTNCFMPRPGVDSAVVQLRLLPEPRVAADKEKMFKIIHAAFGKRRKTLLNALDSEGIGGGKTELAASLEAAGINPQARGETLDIFQFAKLTEAL
ncbi:MAG: 16S rRNA (adenine(1518)-N(6)/adenine(1519)-N(6))-dimethyltransferase RsmA [Defluviitaleaceae bacterium]|nr:16S rRNA (adenine(1518)-N(6)/adenine(1519)-N(6))-dimethyltransferase RsmA [Defluviitaleaceae bacterium]MCL2262461.1 16S rRNA (adenine(1518)-N(6)/adenine(1519)-N(6))-dimethyltransferase RsmA [Defluviitaleaceae bacterium]